MADVPEKISFVRALYDYARIHTDELSFKKGDILAVSRQLDGGWWEGSLNGVAGWFPSNYVVRVDDAACGGFQSNFDRPLVNHLYNFQEEILQHILEGEVRQANELAYLVSNFITQFEPLGRLSPEPKRVGKLFLDFAPTVNAIGCDYSKIHLYVITGLDKNADILDRHFSSHGVKFQVARCKQQLSLIFDRLGRYPLLLKEMERYLENSHVDCEDIQKAMNVYSEITVWFLFLYMVHVSPDFGFVLLSWRGGFCLFSIASWFREILFCILLIYLTHGYASELCLCPLIC
ncbi:hypothetical protein P879_02896 [Paragonimus westermani]|uniref:Uncharacterized protein n=1 Tax=Paragonimus westermani TaxID=34504 RepID=A0A8T0DVY4_9TREM|nr:hypothetical protein P879_02896 [Paragonimus westermani]